MRWSRTHQSDDVIDRRGAGPGLPGGMLFSLAFTLVRRFGLIGVVLVLIGAGALYFLNSRQSQPAASGDQHHLRGSDEQAAFVGFVLDDAQALWRRELEQRGKRYEDAKLVLFTDQTSTGCGYGSAATGPFYCPADKRAYIDLGFYAELERQLGAGGDFAQAYVLAHEIGHHVQNLLGTSDRVRAARKQERFGEAGESVKLELQADCYAGVWAHSTKQRDMLEGGDLEEALDAAAAIGDDRLQKQGSGVVRPETFTHGTSEQRARWWRRGYESGRMEDCDTFGANVL